MIYSIWEGKGVTLISGEGPPRFVDGSLQDETDVQVAQFEADSWEEARQKMTELIRAMDIAKTDQNIRDEDIAYRLNYSGPKMPFPFRVNADMKGGFTVSLNHLTRDEAERLLIFLRDHHEAWHR